MKLSSNASSGCCFCCYYRSWLTMLLMVSSFIHASPEMTTSKTFTSFNSNYQAMSESSKLNAKLSNTTNSKGDIQSQVESVFKVHNNKVSKGHMYATSSPSPYGRLVAQMTPRQTHTHHRSSLAFSPGQLEGSGGSRRVLLREATTIETLGQHVTLYGSTTIGGASGALTADNYDVDGDVVIQTIGKEGTDLPTGTSSGTEYSTEQITSSLDRRRHNGIEFQSDNKTTPNMHRKGTQSKSNTKQDSNNDKSLKGLYDNNKTTTRKYNKDKVQRTKSTHTQTQTLSAWSSLESRRQYLPTSTSSSSSSSSYNEKLNTRNINFGEIIKQRRNNYSNLHNMLGGSTTPTTWTKHLQGRVSTLVPEEHSQLKRPALLSSSKRYLNRYTRQVEEEQIDKCRTFVEGDPVKLELYSPDYPNDYPKNMNCTRVITAPKGQIIRLDFRNYFNIEKKEDCKFDFLEIRDGQYGFSNLIGKYCGTDFPPEITSKERYLWLFFHSDESIEYTGFTAVYEFIDRNRDAPSTDLNCTIEKDGFEGFINSTDVPQDIRDTVITNKIALDCMWRIQVEDKWKIQVKFMDFKLTKPNDCQANFLDIFPEQTVMPARVKNFCGSAGEGITSESNILHMRFYAEQSAINSSFSILYTAFRDRSTGTGTCNEGEYDCEDATCIAADLKCNGRDNCKFRWDEEGCKTDDEGQSEHMIIIITVFGLILGGMIVTFLVNCVRKIMHDQRIIREHIRQSKESKLNEMGRNSKTRSRDNISIVSPRQKHSQTSLQILDDVSNRYYREIELQTKGGYKEKDPNYVRRHDMIVQTSLCSTDNSSTTTAEQPPTQPGACDMGVQTRESLFGTASLLRSKSKTPSSTTGSHRIIEGVPPPPRFSTFGYDAAQVVAATPMPSVATSTLSRRNMPHHLPHESIEPPPPQPTIQTHMTIITPQQQQQHRHLHHRPSQEVCHHHHQHQQMQKQTLPRHQHQHYQEQQQQQHHQPPTVHQGGVMPPPPPGTTIVTAISTGSSAARARDAEATSATHTATQPASGPGSKGKHNKVDESKIFIDIRNSAPDVIIMTSH